MDSSKLIDTNPANETERAVLVKLITPANASSVDARNPLGELKMLAEAAGAEVVDGLLQKRMKESTRTHIGKGKVEELTEKCEASEANLVIFDDELTPAQIRTLEKATNRRVIDRSELILDIFASRARTREARLQVEIAQLEYTSPRLRGMWTHLERIAGAGGGGQAGSVGGIGTRGPGERQIEVDRRIVRDRLTFLRKQIQQIDDRKTRAVKSRSDQFTISLVGYTNAGKSTLMNALTDAGQDARDMLFATLDTKTVRWDVTPSQYALISDTVGFVRNLPHKLVASFKATLEEAIHADLLFHVVDASSKDAMRQVMVVKEVLEELGCGDRDALVLLNKIDQATDLGMVDVLEEKHAPAFRISAKNGNGLAEVADYIVKRMSSQRVDATVRLGASEGKLLNLLTQHAEIHEQTYDENMVTLELTADRTWLAQLQSRYPSLETI
ncbi:MAG TPA: GTPase HflX [Phycisphaerae bacterium]|nr:GTPase HflX [Phycisphaerae bacterium]